MSGGRLSQALVIKEVCHLCSDNIVENKAHFVPKCLLYKFIRGKFSSLLQNVVLATLNTPISEWETNKGEKLVKMNRSREN